MKYKYGDNVRIKKRKEKDIRPEAIRDLRELGTDKIFTIFKKADKKEWDKLGQINYIAEEFENKWRWREDWLELVIYEPIQSRFEILDL